MTSLRMVVYLRHDGTVHVPKSQFAQLWGWFKKHKKYLKIEAGKSPAPPQEPPVQTGKEELVALFEFGEMPPAGAPPGT